VFQGFSKFVVFHPKNIVSKCPISGYFQGFILGSKTTNFEKP